MTKDTPRGPIKFARRRVLPALAKLCAISGLGVLALWVLGRVLTDQYAWSQYLWWAPPIWSIGSAWGLLVLSAILGKFSLRPGGVLIRPFLLFGCVGASAFLFFGIWRMHRVVLTKPHAPRDQVLRVMHWNQTAYKAWDRAAPVIIPQDPDMVFIVNSRRNRHRVALVRELSYLAPSEEEFRVAAGIKAHFQPEHFTVQGEALVASRFPILRTGSAWLGRVVDPETASRPSGQHGWVMFIEFDLREKFPQGPSSMVVWLVDLPSEPTLWRMTSMRAAISAINRWNGNQRVSNGTGGWDIVHTDDPFPEPDLVVGDFNTLRGSASLDEIAPSMNDAFAQSGHGRGKSWIPRMPNRFLRQPMKLADWHIDLAMTGYKWRADSYRFVEAPVGPHKMQLIDVSPAFE